MAWQISTGHIRKSPGTLTRMPSCTSHTLSCTDLDLACGPCHRLPDHARVHAGSADGCVATPASGCEASSPHLFSGVLLTGSLYLSVSDLSPAPTEQRKVGTVAGPARGQKAEGDEEDVCEPLSGQSQKEKSQDPEGKWSHFRRVWPEGCHSPLGRSDISNKCLLSTNTSGACLEGARGWSSGTLARGSPSPAKRALARRPWN